jgi:hypothetical protein
MPQPLITHQVFYAKDFYQHSGDVIVDMRKVCKLDNPSWDFSSPRQILKFMRKQYQLWLEQNPGIRSSEKPGDNKVAWESDEIKAEIWHILIAYSCYIPMTNIHGFINGLPRFDVMKPQYNANIYHFMDSVFEYNMTQEQLVEKAKEILNMPNTEIMDIIADRLVKSFNFKKASKILSEFHEDVSPQELDNELWDLYSDVIGYNILDDETIKERYLYGATKHFSIHIHPMFSVGATQSINIDLIPKRWECISNVEITSENFRNEYLSLCDKVLEAAKNDFPKIALLCENVFVDDATNWKAPEHMHDSFEMEKVAKEVLHEFIDATWTNFGFEKFSKQDEFDCNGISTGCFGSRVQNENGKMKVSLELQTLFENGCFEHNLHNYGALLIDSPKK